MGETQAQRSESGTIWQLACGGRTRKGGRWERWKWGKYLSSVRFNDLRFLWIKIRTQKRKEFVENESKSRGRTGIFHNLWYWFCVMVRKRCDNRTTHLTGEVDFPHNPFTLFSISIPTISSFLFSSVFFNLSSSSSRRRLQDWKPRRSDNFRLRIRNGLEASHHPGGFFFFSLILY